MILTFTVYGVALPKGNHKAVWRPGMQFPKITESNRNVASWQQLVKEGASQALNNLPDADRRIFMEGVRLTIGFVLPRPQSLAKRITAHLKAPDLDRLIRAIFDGLTGTVYQDDRQVCELVAAKRYATIGEAAHVWVRVEPTAGIGRTIAVPPAPLPLLAEA